MRRRSTVAAAATALAVTTIAAAATGSAAHAAPGAASTAGSASTALPGSTAPFVGTNKAISVVPAGNRLTIQVWLKPQTATAESYAAAVSTPGSKLFRHFLTPAAYTARYGATQAEASAVTSWLTGAGFTGVHADSGRDYVQATGAVSTIDSAMSTTLRYYSASKGASAGKYLLRANDKPVSVPSALAGVVLGVTGLDNASPVTTYVREGNPAAKTTAAAPGKKGISYPCSSWYLQHYVNKRLPEKYDTVKFPTVVCGYSADQLRSAYGYNRHNIGKGVTVALVEVGLTPDMFETLQDYAKVNRIETPSTSRYEELSLGKNTCGDPFDVEEQLDVESAYDMAPLASQLVVGGDSCNDGFYGLQALFDADLKILDSNGSHPLAQIASNSWEGGDEAIPVNQLNIEHAYLLRAAAEGVSMLFSSGDGSGVETPSSDPYATSVGGTTLGIGRHDPRLFETGWSTGISGDVKNKWIFEGEQGAAGGGPSLLWKQPAYQQGVVPAALAKAPGNRGGLVRAVPDISADADPFTGMNVGLLNFNNSGVVTGFVEESVGGTSLASPLVAGLVADAEQYQHPFGFLNPGLYKLAGTSALNDPTPITSTTPTRYKGVACDVALCGMQSLTTFDDQSFSMLGYTGQVTRKGYDTMTGVGTPHGQNFVYDMRALFS